MLDDHGQNVVHARGLTARPPRRIGARENWLIALRAPLPDTGGISRSRPVAHHPDRERTEVNAPGRDTERVPEEQTRQIKEWITGQIPLTRFGHPDEIAAAVPYLASSESAFVVDTELVVDGETIQL